MSKTIAVVCLLGALAGPAGSGPAPSEADLAYSHVQYALAHRDWRQVIEHARQILAVQPERADIHRLVGECLVRLQQPADALVHLREWARLQPDSIEATAAIEQAAAHQHALEATRAARERERDAVKLTLVKPSLAALARERRAKVEARASAELADADAAPASRAALTDMETEAVYAAALSFAVNQLLENETVACVAVGDKDPDGRLLKQVDDVRVRKGSECETSARGATLRRTGQPAVWLGTRSLERVSADEVWVEIRHVRTDIKRGIRQYRVVRKAGSWVALGQILKDAPL